MPFVTAERFFRKLTKETAPWAFQKGEVFRAIASLEMFATFLGIILLDPCNDGGECAHKLRYLVGRRIDDIGNRFVVKRLFTTKWPLVAFFSPGI